MHGLDSDDFIEIQADSKAILSLIERKQNLIFKRPCGQASTGLGACHRRRIARVLGDWNDHVLKPTGRLKSAQQIWHIVVARDYLLGVSRHEDRTGDFM
jgi:hypothetical protein